MIDVSLIKYLPDAAQAELRNWESLFASKGWKQLQNVLEARFEQVKNQALYAKAWEDNRVAIGQMDALASVNNLQDRLINDYEALAREVQLQQQEAAESAEAEYE